MGDPPANPQMYRQVRMMEPVAFAQYFDQNAEQLRTKVSRAEFTALQNYRIALQDNNVRTVQATALTNQTINAVKRDLAAAGINTTAKGSGRAAEKLQLFEAELLRVHASQQRVCADEGSDGGDGAIVVAVRRKSRGRRVV
jgi:hypothetical protein